MTAESEQKIILFATHPFTSFISTFFPFGFTMVEVVCLGEI
jgi:hypothetical protein